MRRIGCTILPLLFFLGVLLASACSADENNKLRLKTFLSAAQYDVQCFDLVSDPQTIELAVRMQAWAEANVELLAELIKNNEGRSLPYHESMAASGITAAAYAEFLKKSQAPPRVKDVGKPLAYATVIEGDHVRFVPKAGEGAYDNLDPTNTLHVVNVLLTSARFNLADTKLELLDGDIGEATWKTGESDLLGPFRGFEWKIEDDRLLDFKDLPEGEMVANAIVRMYYSAKQRKTYCKFSVASADRDGIHINAHVNFWLSVHPTSR